MGKIINVKELLENAKIDLQKRVNKIKEKGINPKIAVIIANDMDSTKIYVRNKKILAEKMGIQLDEYIFDVNVTREKIISLIENLNNDSSIHGILLQLPLFSQLNEKELLDKISIEKDIDCFHPYNLGKIFVGDTKLYPCTPKGVMLILESLNENLAGKKAVVVGRSNIVGKPVAHMLLNKNATVTICHSKTVNLKEETSKADILVVACGKANYITKEYVKENAIVIDVGINRLDGKVVGDVDTLDVLDKVKYITKVPGGVGLTTVYCVMDNLCTLIEKKINI